MSDPFHGTESTSLMRHDQSKTAYMESRAKISSDSGRESARGSDAAASEEMDYIESDAPLLSQFHEDAIQQAGMGSFQRLLMLATGLGLAADTIELFVVAYVIPSAEVEFCMSGTDKGWMAAVTFIGMMIGAIVWGILSDKIGRRRAFISALFVNAVFGLMTAFMPTYGIFITSRLCSGIGIGGSIPIVFAYYSEFVTRSERGRYLSWLLVFWAIGGVFTALMAWAIIPRTGITVVLEGMHHFSSWRIFLVVCSLPSFAAVISLYFMPESPRFLLEQGRDVEAFMVYKKIFKLNNVGNPAANYQLTELELPQGARRNLHTETEASTKSFLKDLFSGFDEDVYGHKVFNNTSMDNIHYFKTIFNNVTFDNVVFNHVIFENSSIFDCTFSDIRSSKTFFRNSYVARNSFVDTDMYEYRFENCEMVDNTFRSLVTGCTLDFDYNIHYEDVFQENLIGQLTIIPGTLLTSLLMNHVGRVKIMSVSMLLSGVSAFFIWFLGTKTGVITFEAVFNFIFISGWNALDIATTEVFPTHIRTTAYGFLSAVSRVAGILGSLCFGRFIYASRAVPMLTTTVVLLLGGLVALKLKETKDILV